MTKMTTNDLYPPTEVPQRHKPWLVQAMVALALLFLTVVVYAVWNRGRVPAGTLELPTMERPASNPPQEAPQRGSPIPNPIAPIPTPVTP